ncbi:MAG: uroporphyrinogen decarboxylase [Oscillatoriales cyanobacterium SM2_2_1]|nr:uroporphyrinogen decarboxylase [Oscillatoriales cyanobacterium SM2_2_1]
MSHNDRILRAVRGEPLDRPPVWMMRQAGRYMAAYRALREKYPTFRERSENPDLAAEISLQPFRAFAPDGVIFFSDILTPLPGIGINFDIIESRGPIIDPPIRSWEQVDRLKPFDPDHSVPFVRQTFAILQREVQQRATILGFVGAPWTLAAYAVEGKSSKDYTIIKSMAYREPQLLAAFLQKLTEMVAHYVCHQIECGAQVVQLFDSWAGQLSPVDYERWALPYERLIVEKVKAVHPEVPIILYINGSAGILTRMPLSGVDVISLDWTVSMDEARQQLGPDVAVQGNLDPGVLFAPPEVIRDRILEVIKQAGDRRHIMNLGHGILATTPEEHARVFFETVQGLG